MAPFALTIFAGAFLLFLVQPLLGRYILPWFGGTPAVWSSCLLFFQVLLLAGYAYAHATSDWLRPRVQAGVHLLLLLGSLAIMVGAADRAVGGLEAHGRRVARLADHGALGRDDRHALLRALDDRPADAAMVRAGASGPVAVSAVRAVERGLAAGAGQLPVRRRTSAEPGSAIPRLVVGLCGVCAGMRVVRGVVVSANARGC